MPPPQRLSALNQKSNLILHNWHLSWEQKSKNWKLDFNLVNISIVKSFNLKIYHMTNSTLSMKIIIIELTDKNQTVINAIELTGSKQLS